MLRKVVKLGGSYYIALPKAWLKAAGVGPGDYLELRVRDSSVLEVLVRAPPDEQSPRTCRVLETPWLEKSVLSAYLKGYDVIEIAVRSDSKRISERIERLQRLLIGLEIIEEREDRVVLQCFTRTGYNLMSLLARMDSISREMYVDAAKSLVKGDLKLAKDVIARDDRLDRLYFLTVREVRARLLSPETAGIERLRLMDLRLLSRELEEIGDLSESIARQALKGYRVPRSFYREATYLSDIQERIVRGMLKGRVGDYSLAIKIDKLLEDLSKFNTKYEPYTVLLKRIAEKVRDIADLAPY